MQTKGKYYGHILTKKCKLKYLTLFSVFYCIFI